MGSGGGRTREGRGAGAGVGRAGGSLEGWVAGGDGRRQRVAGEDSCPELCPAVRWRGGRWAGGKSERNPQGIEGSGCPSLILPTPSPPGQNKGAAEWRGHWRQILRKAGAQL